MSVRRIRELGNSLMITIRGEAPADRDPIRVVNREAFSRENEAALVDTLRGTPGYLSLVAVIESAVVGHILFTPATIDGPSSEASIAALGPMAVLPIRQRQRVGSRLVPAGLEECRRLGYDAVVVLGHPRYYPRFDFIRASSLGLRFENPVGEEFFMAIEMRAGALSYGGGIVNYRPEFSGM